MGVRSGEWGLPTPHSSFPLNRSRRNRAARISQNLPLMIEQPALAIEPAAVAGQRAVGADHAMAGNDNGNRISPIGGADRPAGLGLPDAARQVGIADCRSKRDATE